MGMSAKDRTHFSTFPLFPQGVRTTSSKPRHQAVQFCLWSWLLSSCPPFLNCELFARLGAPERCRHLTQITKTPHDPQHALVATPQIDPISVRSPTPALLIFPMQTDCRDSVKAHNWRTWRKRRLYLLVRGQVSAPGIWACWVRQYDDA
jgi:hypothetical protein